MNVQWPIFIPYQATNDVRLGSVQAPDGESALDWIARTYYGFPDREAMRDAGVLPGLVAYRLQ